MQWWPESSLILNFNQSRYYRRLLSILYLFSGWGIYEAHFGCWINGLLCLCLCGHGWKTWRLAVPTGEPVSLQYRANSWQYCCGVTWVELSEMSIVLHAGAGMVLKLRSLNRTWYHVIFADQLSVDERRRLLWLDYTT